MIDTDVVDKEFPRVFTNFLRVWLDWAEGQKGTGDTHQHSCLSRFSDLCQHSYLSRFSGLCENFRRYCFATRVIQMESRTEDWHGPGGWKDTLCENFIREGLDHHYPFGKDEYEDHIIAGAHHTHQPRLDWVRSYIARNATEE